MKQKKKQGFSLVELLVTLSILAVLATVAVQSTEGLVDQSRKQSTVTTLEDIRTAVLGDFHKKQLDGTPLITGFVADLGRLPQAIGNDPATQLSELWSQGTLPNFQLYPDDLDNEVSLFAGWRPGGYLRLGLAETTLTDGSGQNFDLRDGDGVSVDPGDPIESVFSNHINADLPLNGSFTGEVKVTVTNASGTVLLRLFKQDISETDNIGIERVVLPDPTYEHTFMNVPVGRKVLRAYPSGSPPSKVVPLVVIPGGVEIEIELP